MISLTANNMQRQKIPLHKPYSRITLFGRPGSGKSTFGVKLSTLLNIPIYHLDRYFFIENWLKRDYQQFLDIQQEIVNQDRWIIDGNSIQSLEMRWAQSDLVLYFNYPRHVCYWRIFKRFFTKDITILDRPDNTKEIITFSFLTYIWNMEKRVAEPIRLLKAKYPHILLIEINNDNDLKKIETIIQSIKDFL
jgi:hypothetical protein